MHGTSATKNCCALCTLMLCGRRTPDSERIKYLPTIYPYDSVITMWARTAQPPAGAESNGTDVFSTLDAAAAGGLRQRSSSRPQRA